MKNLLRSMCIACLVFSLSSISAFADNTSTRSVDNQTLGAGTTLEQTVKITRDHVSYNYGTDKMSITGTDSTKDMIFERSGDDEQLTVMLIKGAYEGTDVNASALNQTWDSSYSDGVAEICYVDQKAGTNIAEAFVNMGVKAGELEPGVYTLIAGSENGDLRMREQVYVGGTDNLPSGLSNATFFSTHDSVYVADTSTDPDAIWDYSYACVSEFENFSWDKCGWLLRYVNTSGQTVQTTIPISAMKIHKGNNLEDLSITGTISIGFQMNNIPTTDNTPTIDNFVAIPYRINN